MSYTPAEVSFLIEHHEEIAHLDLALTKASRLKDTEVLKEKFGDYGRAVMELVTARSSGKLPSDWLMDADSAQQATPVEVAAYRAEFLAEQGVSSVHDITCSIGTEGLDSPLDYFGSDLDESRVRMARHNLSSTKIFRADALTTTTTADVLLADPARRAGGRRITRPEDLVPPLPEVVDKHRGKELAIKCAPGLDFSEWNGLVTVASVDGGVKEACLYTPGLGTGRRAVMIRGHKLDVLDDKETNLPEAGEIGSYLIDSDGAIVRSGLVRHYAAREGLHQIDERIAYLTGERIPEGTSGFPFIEKVPLKRLKSVLKSYDAGSLEILVRGVEVDPDQLRKKMKLKGKKPFAVIITRIGAQGIALLCKPRVSSSEDNYAT
ncbi:SAM-dependent methyltransferase [Corynebacterium sp. KPL3954]|uniref:THUMP-like domain-containing protein n=1 Tax=Corynebacterium sp. KPL3954 TaxID=3158325 RepID=UPI0032ED19F9